MLRHNFLLAYRSFRRYKSSFFINLIGLSTGLTCALLIYLWVYDELSVNKFHENEGQLYRTLEHTQYNEDIITWKETAGPVAKVLEEEMPEVVYVTAVAPPEWFGKQNLTAGEKNIKALGQYVGKDYFNIFSYESIRQCLTCDLPPVNIMVEARDVWIRQLSLNMIGSLLKSVFPAIRPLRSKNHPVHSYESIFTSR